ncbi:hypothetical protein PVAP13_8KG273602 [Panicum virgatum]|uniref:Uncharacterized protein n=1 Tax=Panicum virgatum TaxID=38727 RepID=A0A8T0PK51_PANVG|nr:hypothetical protein PVAP13_8KG273602 [Panicum virgatum]
MDRCPRVLGWLLAKGLAGSWPPEPMRTAERCSGSPRLGPSRWSGAEVTSTGERASCRARRLGQDPGRRPPERPGLGSGGAAGVQALAPIPLSSAAGCCTGAGIWKSAILMTVIAGNVAEY